MSFVRIALLMYNLLCALIGISKMMMGVVFMNIIESDEKVPIDLNSPALAMIALGAIICGIAFVYCFGVLGNTKCMSKVYVCIILILIVIQIAFSSFFICFNRPNIVNFIVDGYTNIFNNRDNEVNMNIVNTVQKESNCCGLDNFHDFLPDAPPDSCGRLMTGCRGEILEAIHKTFNIVIWFSLAVACVEFVGLILACLVVKSFTSNIRVA